MAERWEHVDLESALVELGRQLEYPPTPDVAARAAALRLARRARVWERLLQHPLRLALAGLLVLVLALIGIGALSPDLRTVVADRLGLRGAPIEQVSRLPTVTSGADLGLGDRITLAEARSRVPVLIPSNGQLGEPDAVYFTPTALDGTVSLVYASRPGLAPSAQTGVSLLAMESRLPAAGFQPAILGKGVGPATRLEEVSVNGGRGVWLEGAPHVLFLPDANGQLRQEPVRLAGNVLLWEQSGLLIRLEGSFSRDQALAVAASMR